MLYVLYFFKAIIFGKKTDVTKKRNEKCGFRNTISVWMCHIISVGTHDIFLRQRKIHANISRDEIKKGTIKEEISSAFISFWRNIFINTKDSMNYYNNSKEYLN